MGGKMKKSQNNVAQALFSRNKRGQVTLFIILAIVIVFVIIAITLLLGDNIGTFFSGEIDTQAEISTCINEVI